jgi:hypothetical protein
MITILEYKKRFFNLLESQSGNVKPLINEKVQCGNVVPLAKSSNNLTITSDGNGGVIVGGKKLFSASSDEIVGEEVEDINQIKNEEGFKPGDYVLNMANRWGWLVNKTNGSWNGYIIKSDEIYRPQKRCGYYIHEKDVSIDKKFNIIGLTDYSIHKINFSNAKEYENKIIDISDNNLESIPQIVITSDAPIVKVVGGKTTFKLERDYSGTIYQVDFSNTLMGVNLNNAVFVSTYMNETAINEYLNGLDVKKGSIAAGFQDIDANTIYWVYTDTKGMVLKNVVNL